MSTTDRGSVQWVSPADFHDDDEPCSATECNSNEAVPVENNPFSEPWEESDLVLLVANEKFHVHRLVLILNSPVFKAMLKSDFTEARSKEITLPEKDPVEILDLLLQLYPQQGDEITMENVEHILKLADEYQMNSVLERCGSFLRITKKDDADAMYALLLAQKYQLSAVAEECHDILAGLSLGELEAYEEFEDLDSYNLRKVLLPRMRRLEKAITDLQPEISGLLKCATWLWSEAKKSMPWCPVHYASGIPTVSLKDRLEKCEACKNLIR
ncbi:BTB and MATH domain-containing protein 36-like [Montipora capricornis]|uniref:BTB and MATH domain-containing protein 36-like n=1 Tax=Montipora capricornis TaxID=246305 RepID=UPI0035F18B2F